MDKISALMDGELDEAQAREQLARLNRDQELTEHWRTFHVIGDTLRGERALLSTDFNHRLAARLGQEPTVLAPRNTPGRRLVTYALSAAASLSAVALVGWMAFNNPLAPRTEIAKDPAPAAPAVAVAPEQPASIPSDGRMNEYLLAHQGFSPSTSIQGVAPYIRSVSSTEQDRGR